MNDEAASAAILANDPFAARASEPDAIEAETYLDCLAAFDSSEVSSLYL
jgi:hypothetical protein